MKALFDSDIFAYRAASACEDEDEATATEIIGGVLTLTGAIWSIVAKA